MKLGASLAIHAVLLGLSVASAGYVWTREEPPKALVQADVTIWPGKPADLTRVTYETKTKKAVLEPKSDAVGRYFVGSLEKETPPPTAKGDAGTPEPAAAPTRTTMMFVSVAAAEKLVAELAPLRALRAVGKIAADRDAEFGFDKPEGTLVLELGGATRKLVVGGTTPGGADRYVREEASGEVFVLKGETLRSLDSADSRLIERDLHPWKDNELTGAKVVAGDKSRELTRSEAEDGKRVWADPAAPSQADETLSNWLSKVDRLRPNEYVEKLPDGASTVVRVEYRGGAKSLGYLEISKAPGAEGKSDYFVQSEHIRRPAKVPATLAEQVEQDLGSVVR
jgi:hypothetical protein